MKRSWGWAHKKNCDFGSFKVRFSSPGLDILRAVHVPSKENLADLMTKILPRPTFEYLVNMIFIKYKFEKVD